MIAQQKDIAELLSSDRLVLHPRTDLNKLTLDKLILMKTGVFASGIISSPYCLDVIDNVEIKIFKEPTKWVAVKFDNRQWSVFFGSEEMTEREIIKQAKNVDYDRVIKLLINTDWEAFQLYKY